MNLNIENMHEIASDEDKCDPNAIITSFEKCISKETNYLISSLNYQNKETIENLTKELVGDIHNLSGTIQCIIDKHHKDFIATFSSFMEAVVNDLKIKLNETDLVLESKKKANDLNKIKCERDFFRTECFRVKKVNQTLTNKISDTTIKVKILTDEVNSLTQKWKDSRMINRKLLLELDENIKYHKELQREIDQLKEFNKFDVSMINSLKDNTIKKRVNEVNNSEKYLKIIDKLKGELKAERVRSLKAENEVNKMLNEKNKLEKIFIDCVEETRKGVFNRGAVNNIMDKRLFNSSDFSSERGSDNMGSYENFLMSDKRRIMESFLSNEHVIALIKDAIMSKENKENSTKKNFSKLAKSVSLPNLKKKSFLVQSKKNTKHLSFFNKTLLSIKSLPNYTSFIFKNNKF